MKTSTFLLSLLALTTAAGNCDRYPDSEDSDLLFARIVCPDGRETCPPTANGSSILGVEACTDAKDRLDGLKVTLRIAPLEWQNPPDQNNRSVYTASLTGNPCVTASFVTRTTPDLVRIDAEMSGYRTDPIWLQTEPANISDIELLPQPGTLTLNATTTVKLNAMVLTSSGKVTTGTRVYFEAIDVVPPTGTAYIWPGSAIVDLTRTPPTAESTLVTGPSVTSVTIVTTAIPPDVEGAPAAAPMTRQFTMTTSQ